MLNGKTMAIDVDVEHDNVSDIMDKLYTHYGIQPSHQILTFCGRSLRPKQSLSRCNIVEFSTLDLSLKLLSSTGKDITLHLPQPHKPMQIPFNPHQTLVDLKQHFIDSEKYKLGYIRPFHYFVHKKKRYPISPSINVGDLGDGSIYGDSHLHISGTEPFQSVPSVRFVVDSSNGSAPVLRYAYIQDNDVMTRPLDLLIHDVFQNNGLCPHFAHSECPFSAIDVGYNGLSVRLRMGSASKVAIPIFSEKPLEPEMTENDKRRMNIGTVPKGFTFGTLPRTRLEQLVKYFPVCDCCKVISGDEEEEIDDLIVLSRTDKQAPGELTVTIHLTTIPFLFQTDYFLNGRFYPRSRRKRILTLKSQAANTKLFSVMRSPQRETAEILVRGFLRKFEIEIVGDLQTLIVSFFPSLYGGKYNVREHNPNLEQQLTQKTKEFEIDDIGMTLHYGSVGGDQLDYNNASYFMTLDFTKSKAFVVVICVSARCTVSHRSDTRIFTITVSDFVDRIARQPLPNFGFKTSLSSLVCDLQIVSMLTADDVVYEYPLWMRRSGYLLEWTISSEMVEYFKTQCGNEEESGVSMESRVFYDMLSNKLNGIHL